MTSAVGSRRASRLEAALHAIAAGTSRLITATIPAPVVKPSQVFAQCSDEPAYYFATGDRGGDVGLGSATTLESADFDRLPALEVEAREILEHAIQIGIDAASKAPRFFGGIAYAQPPDQNGPWRHFARIRFDVPRYRYLTDGERASVTLQLLPQEVSLPSERRAWLERTEQLLQSIEDATNASRDPLIVARRLAPAAETWLSHVAAAIAEMQRGLLEKVVLAREVTLELDQPPDVARVLDNLGVLSPETTRFAIRRSNTVFLGATPERLVMRLGSEVRTEAVAGSIRASDDDAADHLMASAKERYEHDLVVRELVKKLTALGARPETPTRPSIRQLRHVLHLATTITARLYGPPHVLTLMSRLHPTPAVGGVPEEAAAAFVRRYEGFERGWYAAPIGWFDAQGDGEFVVGLRSGLLEGNVLRLYAGAGIVRDSEPVKELQETELKLQSLLDALGPTSHELADGPLQNMSNSTLHEPIAP